MKIIKYLVIICVIVEFVSILRKIGDDTTEIKESDPKVAKAKTILMAIKTIGFIAIVGCTITGINETFDSPSAHYGDGYYACESGAVDVLESIMCDFDDLDKVYDYVYSNADDDTKEAMDNIYESFGQLDELITDCKNEVENFEYEFFKKGSHIL